MPGYPVKQESVAEAFRKKSGGAKKSRRRRLLVSPITEQSPNDGTKNP
jgi:hypothetical protein